MGKYHYADLAFAVSSPGVGDTAFLDQLRLEGQTVYNHSHNLRSPMEVC